jgi:hypothetical protein
MSLTVPYKAACSDCRRSVHAGAAAQAVFFDFALASKGPAAISFAERSPGEGTLHAQGEHICNGVQLDATEVKIGSHRFAYL